MARNKAVGLDIGTRTVSVAEVSTRGGSPTVTDFAQAELPQGAVREGEVIDPEAVAATIKTAMGETSIRDKRVLLGVANQRVVVRQVTLPYLPEEEMRQSLAFQVQEFIPIPVEAAELDFHTLDVSEDELDRILAVNVKGLYHTANAAIPAMRAATSGTALKLIDFAAGLPPQ